MLQPQHSFLLSPASALTAELYAWLWGDLRSLSAVQDFARLIFLSSAIEGTSFCKVYVAPMEILSCQHTVLRVTSFVAEALPPPELNPVHMRVHVTLRDEIQESLRGLPQPTPAACSAPSYEVCLIIPTSAELWLVWLSCLQSTLKYTACGACQRNVLWLTLKA